MHPALRRVQVFPYATQSPAIFSLVLLFFIIFYASPLVHATVRAHTPFNQLCQEADAIIEATITTKNSRFVDDLIYTDIQLTDITAIKGSVSDPLILTQLGGAIDSVAVSVAGTPEFEAGERKIIFLQQTDSGFVILGAWEGVFTRVEMDADPPSGVSLLKRADGYLVQGFDQVSGELIVKVPEEYYAKPTLFLTADDFLDLINNLQ